MKRIAFAALLAACVPAIEDEDPRGGITIVTVPSPASRGEPFVTSDGWTIRIESLVVVARFQATRQLGQEWEGEGSRWVFRSKEPIEASLRAIPIGTTYTFLSLVTLRRDVASILRAPSITAADEATLRRSDPTCWNPDCGVDSGARPQLVLVASAEKDGRVVRVDSPLSSFGLGRAVAASVTADVFSRVEVGLSAERLFSEDGDAPTFDEIAAADTNRDGIVTIGELHTSKRLPDSDTCKELGTPEPCIDLPRPSVYDRLAMRADSIWGI